MALVELTLDRETRAIPEDVRRLIAEAQERVEAFQRDAHIPGFVASDYVRAYEVLRALDEEDLPRGRYFCEWGSGFGVVACLAAMLGFAAVGIEIEPELVDEACRLAEDFELPVEFIHGSFLPRGCTIQLSHDAAFAWLSTEESGAELGFDPDDFDVIFAYPWPDEDHVTADLFDRYAARGALLITYHGGDEFRVRRKVGKK